MIIPQICSFFDDAGFVVDDWHELVLNYAPSIGERVILAKAGETYASVQKVSRVNHTIHQNLDGEYSQVFDIFIDAEHFSNVPTLRGSCEPSVDIVDSSGLILNGWSGIELAHCPRVDELITHAADGRRTTTDYKIVEVLHVLRRISEASFYHRVIGVAIDIGE